MKPEISAVIPVHNEAGNIGPVLDKVAIALRAIGRTFEIIVVNDGSTDATSAEIARVSARIPECREVALVHRSGQGHALLTGLATADGRWMVTLDGDGQNDPRDIPALFERVASGEFDLVCGWRTTRADGWLRRIMSRLANAVRSRVLSDGVHDAGCQLRVFRQEVRSSLRPMELVQSFFPALAVAAGFRVGEIPVRHRARQRGRSKYSLRQLSWRPAIAMIRLRRELAAQQPTQHRR